MQKSDRRNPKFYKGTRPTTHRIGDILPSVLSDIQTRQQDRPDIILATWPAIIGEKLAPMTRAVSFEEGVLTVIVRNATLHSLLNQHEKPKILRKLREAFRHVNFHKIIFRIG